MANVSECYSCPSNTSKNSLKSAIVYDYVIIGAGVAGLHLAHQMANYSYFDNKKIALVDTSFNADLPNDKLLSFWEKGSGKWDNLLYQSWKQIEFQSATFKKILEASPYTYKTLRFKDFSKYCLSIVSEKSNFHFIADQVVNCQEKIDEVIIKGKYAELTAKVVFDSRISENYKQKQTKYPSVIQSFKGFEIAFDEAVLDANCITMMDYRLQYQQSNSFMYILPKSDKQALFEYTFFAPFTVAESAYEAILKNYLDAYFPDKKYRILDSEKGEIPMTTYPFSKDSTSKIIKIGTAGGWVKASTGYSFKFAEKKAASIVQHIINEFLPHLHDTPRRFQFYDTLFIKLLQNQNTLGPSVFEEMYKKNTAQDLFSFLDQETTLWQELKFISKLPYLPFLKELIR